MAGKNMPKDVEAQIRALPGNNICADCSNINPQWASVTYGSLVCLECSGTHRSLGVHLSFVRSVQMDSWSDKQIAAMQMSGGNAKLVEYMSSRKIPKTMNIATKYNTKQAEYYRSRLARWLEGNKEPPPDPGNYDPVSGGDALGAEPLPGESTEEYNARQARLREAARERLRAKFGDGGMMGGVGSQPQPMGMGVGGGGDMDMSMGGAVRAVGGVVNGIGSFLKNNVLESETVQTSWGAVRRSVAESDVIGIVKRNTIEEGSVVRQGLGGIANQVGDLWEKGGDFFQENGNSNGTTSGFVNGGNKGVKPSGPNFDDDFDDFDQPGSKAVDVIPHAVSAPAMMRSAAPSTSNAGMKLGGGGGAAPPPQQKLPAEANTPPPVPKKSSSQSPASMSPSPSPRTDSPSSNNANSATAKKDRAKLSTSEDFFAEFGM